MTSAHAHDRAGTGFPGFVVEDLCGMIASNAAEKVTTGSISFSLACREMEDADVALQLIY